jgi:UTP--glucose-1-phosphate uridylyltransferase
MHVLTPAVFEILDDQVKRNVRENGQIQLTAALNALAQREKYLALETKGTRHNIGVRFGVVEAQIALALAGADRERMLALLLETVIRDAQAPLHAAD